MNGDSARRSKPKTTITTPTRRKRGADKRTDDHSSIPFLFFCLGVTAWESS
jgi:hypothetical protein